MSEETFAFPTLISDITTAPIKETHPRHIRDIRNPKDQEGFKWNRQMPYRKWELRVIKNNNNNHNNTRNNNRVFNTFNKKKHEPFIIQSGQTPGHAVAHNHCNLPMNDVQDICRKLHVTKELNEGSIASNRWHYNPTKSKNQTQD